MTVDGLRIARKLAIMGLALRGVAQTPAMGTRADDQRHRSRQIHWPVTFDPTVAQSFAHNELLIRADCHQVWEHLVDVPRWPSWLILTKDARLLDGATRLAQGTRFQWNIIGYQEESKIEEFVSDSRLGWYSYTPGQSPLYYHVWLLEPQTLGCRVTTEEVGLGPDAAKSAKAGDTETHRVHDLWLASLRWVSGG